MKISPALFAIAPLRDRVSWVEIDNTQISLTEINYTRGLSRQVSGSDLQGQQGVQPRPI